MSEPRDVCANCGKLYEEHLLWDGNKCAPRSIFGWFPKQVADAVERSRAPFCNCTKPGDCIKVSPKFRCREDNRIPYAEVINE